MKLLFVVVGLVAALLVAEGKFVCPSSPVSQHAGCQVFFFFSYIYIYFLLLLLLLLLYCRFLFLFCFVFFST